jgi:hypothetical protein
MTVTVIVTSDTVVGLEFIVDEVDSAVVEAASMFSITSVAAEAKDEDEDDCGYRVCHIPSSKDVVVAVVLAIELLDIIIESIEELDTNASALTGILELMELELVVEDALELEHGLVGTSVMVTVYGARNTVV